MSKMIIIEGNSNDKDNVRAYMVKGETGANGVSPIVSTSKEGSVTTISITDAEGIKTAVIHDGEIQISDIVDNLTSLDAEKPLSSKQGKVLKDLIDTKADQSTTYTKTESDAKYILKSNMSIVTGTITGDDTDTLSADVSYPTGYTASNCVVISTMAKLSTRSSWVSGSNFDSSNAFGGLVTKTVLGDNNISFIAKNITLVDGSYPSIVDFASTSSWDFKIILMKLPTGSNASLLGDFNQDGTVNSTDLSSLTTYLSDGGAITFEQYANADCDADRDGIIDSADMNRLNQYLNGTIEEL